MAIVYEAEHLRLKRLVAVKFLSSEMADDSAIGLRFRREAEVLARLSHPHIVKVMDFDTTESGEPFLVMELLDGETLARRLERDCMLGLRESLAIAAQLASGLAAAHQAQIVHRDLKPANVFLESLPGEGCAGQAARLRHLEDGVSRAALDPRTHGARHPRVHGAGTSVRQYRAGRSSGRPVLAGGDRL